ncbi:MAG: class I SAM-dependent methyltransferase, partial [Beijerinckiaceae bacterium]
MWCGAPGHLFRERRELRDRRLRFNDIVGVGEHLPFESNTFDAVFSIAVLEHVRDPFRCAAEIARVLKRGGRFYCCIPFLQFLAWVPTSLFQRDTARRTPPVRGLAPRRECRGHACHASPMGSVMDVSSWSQGLEEPTRTAFLNIQLKELV